MRLRELLALLASSTKLSSARRCASSSSASASSCRSCARSVWRSARRAVERRTSRSTSICFSIPGRRTLTTTSRPVRRSASNSLRTRGKCVRRATRVTWSARLARWTRAPIDGLMPPSARSTRAGPQSKCRATSRLHDAENDYAACLPLDARHLDGSSTALPSRESGSFAQCERPLPRISPVPAGDPTDTLPSLRAVGEAAASTSHRGDERREHHGHHEHINQTGLGHLVAFTSLPRT